MLHSLSLFIYKYKFYDKIIVVTERNISNRKVVKT